MGLVFSERTTENPEQTTETLEQNSITEYNSTNSSASGRAFNLISSLDNILDPLVQCSANAQKKGKKCQVSGGQLIST